MQDTTKNTKFAFEVGKPTYKHVIRYLKLYEKKPYPDGIIYYYDNGIYKIVSPGENHYGVYAAQGSFTDETYTIRYISLPSPDWSGNTAFHQLTFINSKGPESRLFIQNAIVENGEAVAQQYGIYALEPNDEPDPSRIEWVESGD